MTDTIFNSLQYAGEYDSDNRKLKKRDKPPGRVQWNLQANIEFGQSKDTSNAAEISREFKKVC